MKQMILSCPEKRYAKRILTFFEFPITDRVSSRINNVDVSASWKTSVRGKKNWHHCSQGIGRSDDRKFLGDGGLEPPRNFRDREHCASLADSMKLDSAWVVPLRREPAQQFLVKAVSGNGIAYPPELPRQSGLAARVSIIAKKLACSDR